MLPLLSSTSVESASRVASRTGVTLASGEEAGPMSTPLSGKEWRVSALLASEVEELDRMPIALSAEALGLTRRNMSLQSSTQDSYLRFALRTKLFLLLPIMMAPSECSANTSDEAVAVDAIGLECSSVIARPQLSDVSTWIDEHVWKEACGSFQIRPGIISTVSAAM